MNWPVGDLDELGRLRALHAALPGALLAETVLATDFPQLWGQLSDVEHSFPGLVPDVRTIRVTARDGERLRVLVHGYSGLRAPFEMVLRPGWCLMQSRFLVFGMAAVADGDGTRFGFLAGLRLPGKRWWSPLLAPVRRRIGQRALRRFETRFGRLSTVDGVSGDTGVSGG